MTKVLTSLGGWRERHRTVRKVSRTSKVRVALEVGYIWNGHPEKTPKCESDGVMGWIYSESEWTWKTVPLRNKGLRHKALSKELHTYFASAAGSVVPCCHDFAVLWVLVLARRADRLRPMYRPGWLGSYPYTHSRPWRVYASVVPRWRGVRRGWAPGGRVAQFVCCCEARVGPHVCLTDFEQSR